jgi:hypothetical protein
MASLPAVPVSAADPSFDGPNNKFGIHIAKPHDEDIEDAAKLVNSNGGGWGYVTVVMQEDDRDRKEWQRRFDKMRELKLIPIVRIATKPDGAHWRRPAKEDANDWAQFLDSLNWVVEPRYVIIFNEPNHASEWGGAVDPDSYAEVAEEFARKINERDDDFVVMMAGLDDIAPSQSPRYEDSGVFLRRVVDRIGAEDFDRQFEAIASHAYPNPGFAGSPGATGKGTVRSYEWMLGLLGELGISEKPVFVTETGWDANAIGRDRTAEYFKYAYENVWLPDERVRAVTPFLLNYQGEPFLKFSWRKMEIREFYPQFGTVQGLGKTEGVPPVAEGGSMTFDLPRDLVEDSNYHFIVTVKNDGQGYWDKSHGYRLVLENTDPDNYLFGDLVKIAPGDTRDVDLYIKTDDPTELRSRTIALYRNNRKVFETNPWQFQVLPLPGLSLQVQFFPKATTDSDKFEVQLFDEKEELVFKRNDVIVSDGVGKVEDVRNIAFGRTYRVVVLHPYYLPRQTYITFRREGNDVTFERMLPFDPTSDGALRLDDVGAFLTQPELWGNFLP